MIIAISIKDCKFFLEYDKDKYPDAPGDCDHSRGPGICNPKKCPINMMERIRTEWRKTFTDKIAEIEIKEDRE